MRFFHYAFSLAKLIFHFLQNLSDEGIPMLFIRNNKSNRSASIAYNKDRKRRPNLSVLSLEFLESRVNPTAIVSTDLLDYAPGSTALITANNFMPGADVTFQVQHVLAGADGAFGPADDIPDTILNSSGSGHAPWTVKDGGAGDLDGLANGSYYVRYEEEGKVIVSKMVVVVR